MGVLPAFLLYVQYTIFQKKMLRIENFFIFFVDIWFGVWYIIIRSRDSDI